MGSGSSIQVFKSAHLELKDLLEKALFIQEGRERAIRYLIKR